MPKKDRPSDLAADKKPYEPPHPPQHRPPVASGDLQAPAGGVGGPPGTRPPSDPPEG